MELPQNCAREGCINAAEPGRVRCETHLHYDRVKARAFRSGWKDPKWSDDLPARLARLTDRRGADECWPYLGARDSAGYGVFTMRGLNLRTRAHRVAVEVTTGQPIPSGLVVDHICRNRLCVNPSHLRLVTPAINATENSSSPPALCAAATHCKRGHPKTTENMYVRPGTGARMCRPCMNERTRKTNLIRAQRKQGATQCLSL